MSSIVFSDFDGVLFNSVKEAYILSRYAFDDIEFHNSINQQEFKLFYKFRYLITHSWQFYYIFELIKENTPLETFETKYYSLLRNLDKSNALIFDKKYVAGRQLLLKQDYQFWDNLDTPYEFFYKLKNLSETHKVIILTNKKRLPVENKLKKYNADKFKLFANEDLKNFKNKADFISNFMQEHKIQKSILIEDSIDNLRDCQKYENIKPVLVDWGYISPTAKGKSLDEIIWEIKESL